MRTLERRLGLYPVIAISMAAMLGSGLFVLPGLAITYTGPSVWLAYLVAGLCVLPASLSKAELATAMPESGGTFVYVDRTFGPLAGTVAGLGLWLSLLLKSAFALVGFSAYLEVLAPIALKPMALVLLVLIIVLNVLGVRRVGRVQTVVVVIAVIGLCAIVLRGLFSIEPEYLRPRFPEGMTGFWSAVSFVYISYAGVTKVAAIAEEVENPARTLPIGILVSLLIVTVLYTTVTFVLVANVPPSQLHGDLRPIHSVADQLGGPILSVAAAVLGVLTMTSMSNSGLLAASRFPFAMSRHNLMPRALHYLSSRWMTPVPAIILTGSLMAIAIAVLDVESLAKLASALMILGYMVENLAVLVLRESSSQWYKPSFRSPLYPHVQVLGVVIGLGLLAILGWSSVIAIGSTTLLGFVQFVGFGRQQTARRGVLGRLGPRRELLIETHSEPLARRAAVVVPLLGRAHGAEGLTELGSALGGASQIEVVHIRDVPEQIGLDADFEDPIVASLERRLRKLAATRSQDIEFDSIVTHDHIRSVYELSRSAHCDWLVMEWRGRTERGVLPFNPLGWLVDHLSCNLALYKDVGSRYVASILAFPEPGPHDALVAMTADHLSKVHDAELTFVRFVRGGSPPEVEQAELAYLGQLRELCTRPAQTRIVHGLNTVPTVATMTAGYDLLVMGSPPEVSWWWVQLRGSEADRLMRDSACSVLRVKAPRRLVDRSLPREVSNVDAPLRLDEYVDGDCVGVRLTNKTKQSLFRHFAEAFGKVLQSVPVETIEEALWERERVQSTATGNGLAVPHATVGQATRSYVGLFTTDGAIDYRAPDGVPVDVFFVTLGPQSDRNTHLRLLSTLAWLATETRFLERVRAADNASELLAVVLASSALQSRAPRPAEEETDLPLEPT